MSQTSRREALKAQQLAQAKAARRMRMIGLGAAVAAAVSYTHLDVYKRPLHDYAAPADEAQGWSIWEGNAPVQR